MVVTKTGTKTLPENFDTQDKKKSNVILLFLCLVKELAQHTTVLLLAVSLPSSPNFLPPCFVVLLDEQDKFHTHF